MAHLVRSNTAASDKNRWSTDPFAFSDAKKVSGLTFILDAAAENKNKKCEHYISPEEDALTENWANRFRLAKRSLMTKATLPSTKPQAIWCNPPFDFKPDFIQCAHNVAKLHGIPVLMMLPYERQTIWWQCMIDGVASKVFVPDRRYAYYEADGKTKKKGINFGSVFVLYDNSFIKETQYIDFSIRKLRTEHSKHNTTGLLDAAREEDSLRRSRKTKVA